MNYILIIIFLFGNAIALKKLTSNNRRRKNINKKENDYLVDIYFSNRHYANGVLLKRDVVITTATQIQRNTKFIDVCLNPSIKNYQNIKEKNCFKVRGKRIHPRYVVSNGLHHNLALLKLRVGDKENVFQTIVLDENYLSDLPLTPTILRGWGWQTNEWEEVPALKHLDLYITPDKICFGMYKEYIDMNFEFCSGSENNDDANYASDGSPLIHMENNKTTLLGLFSWSGRRFKLKNPPNVFLRISYYLKWIKTNIEY